MTEDELDSLAANWHADTRAPKSLKRRTQPQKQRLLRWGPSVAVLAASGLGAIGILLLSSRPMPAFADIEKSLKAVQTAQWEEEWVSYDEKGRQGFRSVTDVFIRRYPAAYIRRRREVSRHEVTRTPGKNGVFQNLITIDSSQRYEPELNKIIVVKYEEKKKEQGIIFVNREINYRLIAPGEKSQKSSISRVRWRTRRADGLLLFERIRDERAFETQFQERFWADPKTLQIVRSEVVQMDQKPPHYRFVTRCRKIRYNPVLTDSVFRLVTPSDAKVIYERDRVTRPAILSEPERAKILKLLQSAITAWNKGDADSFGTYWDFAFRNRNQVAGAQPAALREKQWRIRTRNQAKWAAPLLVTKIGKLSWTNSLGGDLLPEGEALHVETDGVRFIVSQQTGDWKITEMYYSLKKR